MSTFVIIVVAFVIEYLVLVVSTACKWIPLVVLSMLAMVGTFLFALVKLVQLVCWLWPLVVRILEKQAA